MDIAFLKDLRRKLHQQPELSGMEVHTSAVMEAHAELFRPDKLLRFGNTGLGFVFSAEEAGPITVFRAELDALPIEEINDVAYRSTRKGVSHSCGHDGHMTIMAGLLERIAERRPLKGSVVILLQPAEETGQGAKQLMDDPAFRELAPDRIFALHNIPGEELHKILVREEVFAAASSGMTIHLHGKSSHAGEPEKGINPANCIAEIIRLVEEENKAQGRYSDLCFATIINIQLGEIAFGTSPGEATVRLTLRAYLDKDIERLKSRITDKVEVIAREEGIRPEIFYSEEFPATRNDTECVQFILTAARENDLDIQEMDVPFSWSEDFSYYTRSFKGGFFGIGAGRDHPALHNPDYDFPDEIITTGIQVFYSIYNQIH